MRLVLLLLVQLFIAVPVCQAMTLSLTTADNQDQPRSKAMNAVLEECFRRLGIDIAITTMPSDLSLDTADKGIHDGNFLRTRGIPKHHNNLVMVPEAISQNVIVAYSKKHTFEVKGWKSLLPYHVIWVRGWKNCERELKDATVKTLVSDEQTLFLSLEDGRAEIGIFGLETGLDKLKELGLTDIHPMSPPITVSDLYLYMNKEHERLIPKITQALRDMKKDGTYDKILSRIYGK